MAFRKEKTETEVRQSMHEVIPGAELSEIQDDNDAGRTVTLPAIDGEGAED